MIIIAMGSNLSGPWGTPSQTLIRAAQQLNLMAGGILVKSEVYMSKAVGVSGQQDYLNCVVAINQCPKPKVLIAKLKDIEKEAGRRGSRKWSSRTLDLDIISYHNMVNGWTGLGTTLLGSHQIPPRDDLVVPHRLMHLRPFVIRPFMDINPLWHHPVTGETVHSMWLRLRHSKEGKILHSVDVEGW